MKLECKVDNIVIIANIEWKFLKQRHQFLAEGFKKLGLNVIFVESSAKRNPKISDIPRILERLKSAKKSSKTKVQPNQMGSDVHVVTPIVLPSTSLLFNFINDQFFIPKLTKKIEKLLIPGKTAIINYLPSHTALSICDRLSHDVLIYDCVSNFEFVPGMPNTVCKIEDELINKSNFVTYDCNFLLEKHQTKDSTHILIPPGVEFENFNLELKTKKINKVLYFGLLSEKNDLQLVKEISKIFNLDVLGEVRVDIEGIPINRIRDKVNHSELPEVIKEYDALLLPYSKSEYAKGVIPAKFFECLATGLPVIASATPNFLDYKQHLIISEEGNYLSSLENFSFSDEDREDRVSLAKNNDWKLKTIKFMELINNEI